MAKKKALGKVMPRAFYKRSSRINEGLFAHDQDLRKLT